MTNVSNSEHSTQSNYFYATSFRDDSMTPNQQYTQIEHTDTHSMPTSASSDIPVNPNPCYDQVDKTKRNSTASSSSYVSMDGVQATDISDLNRFTNQEDLSYEEIDAAL